MFWGQEGKVLWLTFAYWSVREHPLPFAEPQESQCSEGRRLYYSDPVFLLKYRQLSWLHYNLLGGIWWPYAGNHGLVWVLSTW